MSNGNHRIRPDEILPPDGSSIQVSQLVKDAALLLPNPRVPRRSKIALGMAAAYVVSPVDLIPDVIPVIGWADDVVILMFAIDSLMTRADPVIIEEHWDGPGDLLSLVHEVVGLSRSILPRRISAVLDRLYG